MKYRRKIFSKCSWLSRGAGGHWPRKGVWGCAALKTLFSCLSRSSQWSHFKQKSLKVSSQDPLLRNKLKFYSLYSLNFCPNFSSQAPKFEKFSSQDPSFRAKIQFTNFTSPTLWKSGLRTSTWKHVECPPPTQSQTELVDSPPLTQWAVDDHTSYLYILLVSLQFKMYK